MRRSRFVILSCLALGLALVPAEATTEVTALRIVNKTFDPESQQLGYELFNDSDRVITAWRLGLARGDSHGHSQRSTLDQDFFEREAVPEIGSGRGPIVPGGSVAAQWQLDIGPEISGLEALSLKVIAVVFEDLTWEGETSAASTLLEARSARVQELGRVLAELESQSRLTPSSEAWSAILAEKARRLERQGQDGSEAVPGAPREVAAVVSATRLELAQWLVDAGREVSLSPDPDEAFGYLAGSLRERYERGLRSTLQKDQGMDQAEDAKGGDR